MTSRRFVQGAVAIDDGPRVETLAATCKLLRAIGEQPAEPDTASVSRMTESPGWRTYLKHEAERARKDASLQGGEHEGAPQPEPTRAPSDLYM